MLKKALLGIIIAAVTGLCLGQKAFADNDPWASLLVYFNRANGYPRPTDANNHGFFQWANCWDDQFDQHPIGPYETPGLPKICQPDTLYSWGPLAKLQMLQEQAGKGKAWAGLFRREIFNHINPLATFAYGPIAFRFKLKPGTQFFFYADNLLPTSDNSLCQQLSVAQQKKTVVVRAWRNGNLTGVDYIICSPQVLQSWSYDTRTHYDEVVAATRWNNDQIDDNQNNWIPYIFQNGWAVLFDSGIDGVDWSRDMLIHRLTNFQSMAKANKGEIIYAPGVKPDPATHFSTSRPVYWNTH